MEHPTGWTVDPGEQPPMAARPWFPPPTPQWAPAADAAPPGPPLASGPLGSEPSAEPPPAGQGGSAAKVGAGVVVAALLAAGVGFGAGRLTSDSSPSQVMARAAQRVGTGSVQATGTTPAPLTGRESEPAAAVAKVLAPAVVQLQTDQDLGSGFIYDKSGLILTAAHVVNGASTLRVRLADGTQTDGKVLGADSATDVAVVKVSLGRSLPVATLALGAKVEVGQIAIAIGSPYGLDQTVTQGIVSAVGRAVQTNDGEVAMIQTDAPINPGNSGGALADRLGRVIGINDSIISGSSDSSTSGNVGVGFAIPIDLAKSVADRMVAGKSIDAGYLGVQGNDATGSQAGALIVSVASGTPAAKAGLREGDVVVEFAGGRVQGMEDLAAAVRAHQPGEVVQVTVLRNGDRRTLSVTLGKYQR